MIRAMELKDKVVVVTGAGSGIGRIAARDLAKAGAHVLAIARSEARLQPLVDEVKAQGGSVQPLACDMSVLSAVREAAAKISAAHAQIHALVNNAGLWADQQRVTPEGHDETLAVNALAPHLLAKLLLPQLRAAKGRIVNVASEEHLNGDIHWDDLSLKGRYSPRRAYRQSKLILTMLSIAMSEREPDVQVNALHPGIVGTQLFRNFPRFIQFWINLLMRKPQEGANVLTWHVHSPEMGGVTGKFYSRYKERRPHGLALVKESRERLWEMVEKLTNAS